MRQSILSFIIPSGQPPGHLSFLKIIPYIFPSLWAKFAFKWLTQAHFLLNNSLYDQRMFLNLANSLFFWCCCFSCCCCCCCFFFFWLVSIILRCESGLFSFNSSIVKILSILLAKAPHPTQVRSTLLTPAAWTTIKCLW